MKINEFGAKNMSQTHNRIDPEMFSYFVKNEKAGLGVGGR